ncbi:DUF874 family protein [Helicobacter pylori]
MWQNENLKIRSKAQAKMLEEAAANTEKIEKEILKA